MRLRDNFHVYAIITIIFWALAYVLTRLALSYFSVYSLGFLRYLIASCTLIVVVVAAKMNMPDKGDAKWFAITGATGFSIYVIVFNKGSETLSAATCSVVISTTPVITALLAHFIHKERLKIFQWAAIAVAFSGVFIITMSGKDFTVNAGLFWLFAAVICLSIYNLLQRKLTKIYSALQTSSFSIFAGTAMLALFLPMSIGEFMNAPALQLFYVTVLGIFCSAVAYVSWSKAFAAATNTSSVSNYMFVTPLLTALLGFLIAGELPDNSTIFGGIIIITGLLLFNFGERLNYTRL